MPLKTWVYKHLFKTLLSILLGIYLEVGLLDHVLILYLTFVDSPFATCLDHSCLPVLCGGVSILASLSQLLLRGHPRQPSATCHCPGGDIPGGEVGVSPAQVLLLPQRNILWNDRENPTTTVGQSGVYPKVRVWGRWRKTGVLGGGDWKMPDRPCFYSTAQERLLEAHGNDVPGSFIPRCLCPGVPQ